MAGFIIAAEVAFWVLLAAGLLVRYALKWRRTSAVILLLVPGVDLVLLTVSVFDMRAGATADITHGLAALYLGFSIVYAHRMITWADGHAAHRWGGAPPPKKAPKYGMARARHEWIFALQGALAWALTVGFAYVMRWLVGAPERTQPMIDFAWSCAKIPVILAIIAASYTIWPKKPKNGAAPDTSAPAEVRR